jgi:Mn-dependent DtxR family transcriptional regulator
MDSSSARLAIAELRNEGLVEEKVRGVIRLTALGYEKYNRAAPSYAYAV